MFFGISIYANQNEQTTQAQSCSFRSEIASKMPVRSDVSVRAAVEKRWAAFQAGREFKPFQPGRSDAELSDEFEIIRDTRRAIWTTSDYEFAQHLIQADLIRPDGRAAFSFNNTVPYYNASTIYLGDQCYIACEGPRSKDVSKFFKLLTSQNVTHLVRLTSAYEGGMEKCHPYWEGCVTESCGKAYLNIPTDMEAHSVKILQTDDWKDNQGIAPHELLAMALAIREDLNQEESLLAVHCSAGVGRTGTFLASIAIIDAIDQQIPFSIEEIVYRISLQRISSVAKHSQYIALHRLAETYLRTNN